MIFCTVQEWHEVSDVINSHTEWGIEVWLDNDWRNVYKIWPTDDGQYHISPHGVHVPPTAQLCLRRKNGRFEVS